MKTKKISFKAETYHQIGDVIRLPRPEAKFWKIYKIENGRAFAKADGFGPKNGAC